MTNRRRTTIVAVTALAAAGAPIGAAMLVRARTQALADHLGHAAGLPARIGAVDADLTGTLRLSDVALGELFADEHGVRLITGKLRVHGSAPGVTGELVLGRSAAELSLPHVKFGRVLAVGGTGTLKVGHETIALRDVAIGRLAAGGALEAR